MRKNPALFLGGLILIIGIGLLVGIWIRRSPAWKMSHFICSYPGYDRLSEGMMISEVKGILGKPSRQIQAEDEDRRFYCTFEHQPKAVQCWRYEFRGWDGNILIYFDEEGKLISRSCGTG